ncbi:IDEAL domain-containing protein [Sporosarcina thermotolerans]|uniref:IDEAL domain-containing protein n=2 Tax=Sporosarcina TaxID=1569 RepID=A0ABT8JU02_9BACL|nr:MULTISPECIES: IDEAL domain-containing protein [Sporosarcina]MDN4608595.1 IDEAL domain-containing protein [Sporosarcina highlanderae]MDW0118396.1 IDEAL domain-containing protein [Sporosarcina thermotolerans]
MENNYSYAEFLKAVGKNSSSAQAERLLNDIYMDLFLSHIHREQTKKRLWELIDIALDEKDESTFNRLTDELMKVEDN